MRALPITGVLLGAVLGACSSVHDRAGCSSSADCPAGQYCAATPDGKVCWADTVAPRISGVTVACLEPAGAGSTCLRDGTLRVRATITDDQEVKSAEATFDVGGAPVPLVRGSGDVWSADVPLARLPFAYFEHAIVTTVTARDGAQNSAAPEPAAATSVTRHRFARLLDSGVFTPGHPAVMQDGTVAVAGTNAKVYFVPWDGEGVTSVLPVGAGPISAAPLAKGRSLWVGSEDNAVYEVSTASWASFVRTDDTLGRILGSLALSADDRTLAATESGFVYAATSSAYKSGANVLPFALGPVVDGASIFVVSGGALKRMTLSLGAAAPDAAYSCQFGFTVTQPIALSSGVIAAVSNGAEGLLRRCSAAGGDPEQVATTAIPAGGVAILADASILVPEQTKTVSRWTSTGAAFPGWQKPDLGGATRTPLVLSAAAPFIVPTAKGAIHALRADGTIAWSAQLSAGTASLQPGNLYTPPGQPPGEELSTAYFAGADGVLHAVIVDGKLDGAAPWPKAFHDPHNTNRAGAQP